MNPRYRIDELDLVPGDHSPERMTLEVAQQYAASLGPGWRLPTVEELLSLVDYSRVDLAVDTDAFPDTPSAWFWTSTPSAGDSSNAWAVFVFAIGRRKRNDNPGTT